LLGSAGSGVNWGLSFSPSRIGLVTFVPLLEEWALGYVLRVDKAIARGDGRLRRARFFTAAPERASAP